MVQKNKLSLFAILFALLFSLAVVWQTTEAAEKVSDMANTKTWAGIYYYPSSRVNSGRAVPPNTTVRVDYLNRTGDWAYISHDEFGKGWVRRSSIYFLATENFNESTAEAGQAYSGMETTTTRWGNLHTGYPYRSTDIALAPNTTVTLRFSSVDGNWAYVSTAAKGDGWVPLAQLKISSLDGLPLWR